MPATVLVVDDDRDLTRLMTKFLKLEGFSAAEAYNGQEALKYLRDGGDASVKFGLGLPGEESVDAQQHETSEDDCCGEE